MSAFLLAAVVAGIGVSAYLQARRDGVWSWRRFGLAVAIPLVIGGGVGFLAVGAGRWLGPGSAPALTALAAAVIIALVFWFAFRMRRGTGGR
jgi:hypothetical protein